MLQGNNHYLQNLLVEVFFMKSGIKVKAVIHVVEVVPSGYNWTIHGRFTGHVCNQPNDLSIKEYPSHPDTPRAREVLGL